MRLSGTGSFSKTWTCTDIQTRPGRWSPHDGAIKLTSALDPALKEPKDVFYISFLGEADIQRIADLVRTGYDASDTYGHALSKEIPGGAA